jgi:hypothetical protein
LFVLRYVGAEDVTSPPSVKVIIAPASENDIALVIQPDHDEAVLSRPGTALVVRATLPGVLEVEVEPSKEDGSVAATVNIEPLDQGDAQAPVERAQKRVKTRATGELRVLAHVAGIGDVDAGAGEWLGGPRAPSRIEGISLEWGGKPRGLDISYSVKTAQPLTISGRIVGLGSFAGTRGKAMPLVGVMLELSGHQASRHQFQVDVLFLGAPVVRLAGQRIVASGPTGREPLVGLRVTLQETTAQLGEHQADSTSGSDRSPGRVRVFRSRTAR